MTDRDDFAIDPAGQAAAKAEQADAEKNQKYSGKRRGLSRRVQCELSI
jgi:hypothetical protein